MQSANTVLLIKPKHFSFNLETALTNSFQHTFFSKDDILNTVLEEFNAVVTALQANGISCLVFEDRDEIVCADAVFCNNWFSTHLQGKLIIYPMCAANRQLEYRQDIIDYFKENYTVTETIDLRNRIETIQFLESTGSIVFDHEYKLAFACLSQRTNEELLKQVCQIIGYTPISYNCYDTNGLPIYHTNVILCICSSLIIAYVDGIINEIEKQNVLKAFVNTQKQVILLSFLQVTKFCGNMLSVVNNAGEECLVLSTTAYNAFSSDQIEILHSFHKLIIVNIPTIETIGGGGVRCMLGEIFLQAKK